MSLNSQLGFMIIIEVDGNARLCVLAEASLELPMIGVPGNDAEPEFGVRGLGEFNPAPR